MKIYHNAKKRNLKWILLILLILGIGWMTTEVFSLSFQLVETTVIGCLQNEECFFNFVEYVVTNDQ